MSADTLHQITNNNTRAALQVPPKINGPIVGAVGCFGRGILLAAACAWALSKDHEDHATQTDRMMTLLEACAGSCSQFFIPLFSVKTSVEDWTEHQPPILNKNHETPA